MTAEESKAPAPATEIPPSARPSLWARFLKLLVIGYGLAIAGLWAWMFFDGDRHWLPTLFLFGPRWICALPMALLVPLAWFSRRRLLLPLALIGAAIVGPVMGFQAHLPVEPTAAPTFRVMSCNVDEEAFSTTALEALIRDQHVDVVALEETRAWTKFLWPDGWHIVTRDEFVVASRWPIAERERVYRPVGNTGPACVRFTVEMPGRELQLFVVHLESPRTGFEALINRLRGTDPQGVAELEASLQSRATETERTSQWIAQFPGPKIVLGDFNTPVESVVSRRWWSWLDNAFSKTGWGFGFTKNSQMDRLRYGTRIDQILFSREWRCLRAWVGPDLGSDHLPLLAEFQ